MSHFHSYYSSYDFLLRWYKYRYVHIYCICFLYMVSVSCSGYHVVVLYMLSEYHHSYSGWSMLDGISPVMPTEHICHMTAWLTFITHPYFSDHAHALPPLILGIEIDLLIKNPNSWICESVICCPGVCIMPFRFLSGVWADVSREAALHPAPRRQSGEHTSVSFCVFPHTLRL